MKDITLVLIDGVDVELSHQTLKYCLNQIEFKECKLFSYKVPECQDKRISTFIAPNFSWHDYNNFITCDLKNVINTEFVLICQTDGFISNYHLWTDDFLNYDYIGAPWPDDDNWIKLQNPTVQKGWKDCQKQGRIGNGGFSLRSKKFLEYSSKFLSCEEQGEDTFLCTMHYEDAIKNGIKFPGVETALRFSIENPIKELGYSWGDPIRDDFNTNNSFGFHGKYVTDYNKLIIDRNSI